MAKPHIVAVVGTRPEAIKVAPLVAELRQYTDQVQVSLVSTGQHREILLQALDVFGLRPDHDLGIMQHGQTLAQVTCRALEGIDRWLGDQSPHMVTAQGDTTTTFVASLCAFYRRIPFAHVEAGLRTDTIQNPFPEEFNRRVAALTAHLHFPPTEWSRQNLLREGVPPESILVTGNTGIDAVLWAAKSSQQRWFPEHEGRVVLLTTHRRENWGEPQQRISLACRRLVEAVEDVLLVVPMHPNPSVRDTLSRELSHHPRIRLIEPPGYRHFVKLMQRCAIILSDSGGVQEEAPAFGIPVLVLRDTTERPEGVSAGTAKLVGTNMERIFQEGHQLLTDAAAYASMAQAVSPYGDGQASRRIRFAMLNALGVPSQSVPAWESDR